MMKCEFENLLGYEVTPEEYEKVETVYMQFDYNQMSKEKIANLYRDDSRFIADTLYGYIKRNETETAKRLEAIEMEVELKREIKDLKYEKAVAECAIIDYLSQIKVLELQRDELETQLHQYKALFADMEKNATVNLYKTLLGVTE